MFQADKKSGEGLAHPAAHLTTPANASTVAPAAAPGFDDFAAQNALQQPQTAASTLPPPHAANGAPAHAQHAATAMHTRNQYDSIPQALKELDQWVIAAPDKRPWSTAGFPASVTDPTTWTDFYSACMVAESWGAGIGFVLCEDDPFTCIDLDVKPDTDPALVANFQSAVRKFDSYTEHSRSGLGYHIWVRGTVGAGARRGGVELYDRERFIICTGNVVHGTEIEARQELLELTLSDIRRAQGESAAILVEVAESLTDEEIWNRASTAVNADKFLALWNGQWQQEYPSQSEADLSLLSMLTFYSKSNEQCRRMFRLSALGQRTKATKNNYYIDNTLKLIRGRMEREDSLIEHGKAMSEALFVKLQKQEQLKNERAGLNWPPGVAGKIAQLLYGAAMRPVPEVAIVATLGLLAGVCGNQWNLPKSGLNLYLVLLARSGIGKEAMHEGIAMFVRAVQVQQPDVNNFFDFNEYASGPALIKSTVDRSSFLQVSGEFGRRLKHMSNGKNDALQSLRTAMTKLYSKSGPGAIAGGLTYSDATKSVDTVRGIAYSMIGDSTPGTFREALTQDMMEDGFMSRFTVIEHEGDRPHENPNPQMQLPEDCAKWFAGLVGQALLLSRNNAYQSVGRDHEAGEVMQAFNLECDESIRAAGSDESQRQMWNRAHLKALRIAALLAVADNYVNPCITTAHAEWAIELVRRDIAVFTSRMHTGDIGSGDKAREDKVLAILKDYLVKAPTKGYNVKPALHKAHIVPRKYLTVRVKTLPMFEKHTLGYIAALDLILKSLVRDGCIQLCNKAKMVETYSDHGECYQILDLPHCD